MKATISYIPLLFVSLLSFFSQAADDPTNQNINIVDEQLAQPYNTITFASEVLQEQRKLLVNLPEKYKTSDKSYPVLFLLDGNRHFFHSLASSSTLVEEQRMPESIIVAITNGENTRRRDLAQQSEHFLTFIKQEVIPLIEKTYRTTDIRTLFGHSLAGYFTINALMTQPELFSHYIAASPVLQVNKEQVLANYKKNAKPNWLAAKSLYLSLGEVNAEGKRASQAFDKFTVMLEEQPTAQLRSLAESMPTQVHMTTPNLTLYQGLTHAFNDYAMPIITQQQVEQGEWGLEKLKRYYSNRADKYQASATIPENVYRRLGFALQDNKQSEQALKTLKENVKQHKDSPRALNALAQVYEATNNQKLALKTYQQALTLEAVRSSERNLKYFERQVKKLTTEADSE